MAVFEKDGIKVAVLEMIPLEAFENPKQYLMSFCIIDGNKRYPPIFKIVSERDDLRKVILMEIEVYKQVKSFLDEVFEDAVPI